VNYSQLTGPHWKTTEATYLISNKQMAVICRQGRVLRCISVFACLIFLIFPRYYTDASSSATQRTFTGRKVSHSTPSTKLSGFGSRTKKSIFAYKDGVVIPITDKYIRVKQCTTDGGLLFQCHNNNNTIITVHVSIVNGKLKAIICNASDDRVLSADKKWIPVDGIYGVLPIPSGGVLWVLLTSSDMVYEGPPWGEIRQVKTLEIIHMSQSHHSNNYDSISSSQRQIKEETRQFKLLRQAFKDHTFYFLRNSQHLDMTQTLQRGLLVRHRNQTDPVTPDSRFFWNEPHLQLLRDNNDDEGCVALREQFVIPVTSAFVGVQPNISVIENGIGSYDELLISRRSRFRAGTRFTKRGADSSGHVANYAETEQVCVLRLINTTKVRTILLSHVQTRGSIPLRWSSPADVTTYAPKVRIGTDPLAQARSMMRHIQAEWNHYCRTGLSSRKHPQLVFCNLIDKKKDQGRLGRAFDAVLQALLDVYSVGKENSKNDGFGLPPKALEHIWFDFHAEVKNGQWDKLVSLLNQVKETLDEHAYFSASMEGNDNWTVLSQQRGIIRTNCMDCLDRTNVVQSIFGRYMLYRGLSERPAVGMKRLLPVAFSAAFRKNPMVLPWSGGEVSHRLLWADNADAISRLYAGTPALKGDFTRTGKRTKRGALDDGMNSLQRYYLNNFLDADRQEGIDLMVGYAHFAIEPDADQIDEKHLIATNRKLVMPSSATAESLLSYSHDSASDVEDESEYFPIEQRMSLENRLRNIGGGSIPGHRQGLDLRWLPGDLQSQMKSQATATSHRSNQSISDALEAMDRRSATDQPWWVVPSDADNEKPTHDLSTSSPNAGHVIGGLIAATQAPITTAVAVVCMLGLSVLESDDTAE